jgi:ATP-dependent DNA helicase DinG
LDAATELGEALEALAQPMRSLVARLFALLDEKTDELDSATRQRIDATARGIRRRAEGEVVAWIAMLTALHEGVPAQYADWLVARQRQDSISACTATGSIRCPSPAPL